MLLQGLILILILVMLAGSATADEVYLKDGQRLISPRAWVADNYVYFILEGTTDVEIRYALSIIDRVLTAEGKQIYPSKTPQINPSQEMAIPTPTVPSKPAKPAPPMAPKVTDTKPPAAASAAPAPTIPMKAQQATPGVDTTLLRAKAKKLRKVPFYDPRRQKKYWASAQSRYNDVEGAVNALAELFARTPEWVTDNMGTTNDLGEIHLNLIRQIENWNPTPATAQAPVKTVETQMSSASGQPKAQATSPSVPKPPAKAPAPRRKAIRAANPFARNLPDTHGPQFYSPRRPKKFWANESSRHDSLDAALKALAEQYGQSVQWVEAHMGESNSLQEIHHNLTQAAERENE